MKIFKPFFLVLAIISIIGCASSGPKFSEMQNTFPELTSEKGRIYVYRKTVAGAALQPKVMINGEEAGKAVPQGFFYVDKEPGNYEIMTSTEVKRSLTMTLEKAQTRYVRLNLSMGFFVGHVYPELVDNETGESEMQNCRYIGNDLQADISK